MKITTLVENRTISADLKCSHGLSLFIETKEHKILFDMGANDDFIDNAKILGVDLSEVDIAIISHGHYDHGGGLEGFLEINQKAKIYISREFFDKHLKRVNHYYIKDIGVDKALYDEERFIKIDVSYKIDDELIFFEGINDKNLVPFGNRTLLKKEKFGKLVKDDFDHEINLLVKEDDSTHLICGCAHKGIVNILSRAKVLIGGPVHTIVGGFHLRNTSLYEEEGREYFKQLAKSLGNNEVKQYYTCHCTGEVAFDYLSQKLDNIDDLKTGVVVEI